MLLLMMNVYMVNMYGVQMDSAKTLAQFTKIENAKCTQTHTFMCDLINEHIICGIR